MINYLIYNKMKNLHKRFLLFLFGCITLRWFLVFLAKGASKRILLAMGIIALLPAIGFFYLFFSGKRKVGTETFGAKIWWNNLRPVHGILYFLFAIYAIYGDKIAWIFLLLDVIIGLVSFLLFHTTINLH